MCMPKCQVSTDQMLLIQDVIEIDKINKNIYKENFQSLFDKRHHKVNFTNHPIILLDHPIE